MRDMVQLGSKLYVQSGYGYSGVNIVRVADNGQVLVGVFTDRLREYPTDWTFDEVMEALREYEKQGLVDDLVARL
ncbi:hypothetical protein [Mycobacterium avium]|uniref:hypothetical protein n=1 Tax=Mycobacterium avium TaxID=1764 RepID=UPI0007A00CB6|nr:hypothetical protein [Mycobacterium avium]